MEATQKRNGLVITDLQQVEYIARLAAQAGFFKDVQNMAQGVIKITYGLEYGMSPMEALNGLQIIKGKVSMAADAIAERMVRGGAEVKLIKLDEEGCEAYLEDLETKENLGSAKFTAEQARKAGYYNKQDTPWQWDPESMLYARVVTRLHKRFGRKYFNHNVQSTEEMQDIVREDEEKVKELLSGVGRKTPQQRLAEANAIVEASRQTEVVETKSNRGRPRKEVAAPEPEVQSEPEPQPEAPVDAEVLSVSLPDEQFKALMSNLKDVGAENGWTNGEMMKWTTETFKANGVEPHNFRQTMTLELFDRAIAHIKSNKPSKG